MSIVESPWINFLRQYGPIPRNDNMYDEAIQRVVQRKSIQQIKIESPYIKELVENFQSNNPKSIILTGTAGDGKTYHCREVWFALGGTRDAWENSDKIKELTLWNQKKLNVIKDLSELRDEEKNDILKKFVRAVMALENNDVFLIAANDGQLIETWKYVHSDLYTESVKQCVEDLLVNEVREKEGYHIKLYNLSQVNAAKIFQPLVTSVLQHPGWNECKNCSLRDHEDLSQRCPIWENRKRLEGHDDNQTIQLRLIDLLELCELNGIHLPIRQLLLLVSNMILGHPEAKDGLLNCREVKKILDNRTVSKASIYRNIFGENLSERRRESTEIFSTLSRFGIGNETSNMIDNILIFGEDDPELYPYYKELVLSDLFYGADESFKAAQKEYLEETPDDGGELFLSLLRSQRQRLFFAIPPEKADELKLWELTTFRYAGEFLNQVYRVALKGEKVSSLITARIVRGLNRIFTGLLTNTQDELILATSGSHSQAKVSRIYEDTVSVLRKRGESVQIKLNSVGKLVIEVSLSSNPSIQPVELPLQLIRFEFLSRVAEGALPGSFSRECYEDILAYKSRLLKQIEKRRSIEQDNQDEEDSMMLNILRLNLEGIIEKRIVEVNI